MFARLQKLAGLPPTQRWVFLEAWCLLLKWDYLVSAVPYASWRDQAASLALDADGSPSATLPAIRAIILASEKAARNHLRPMNCLRRCLCQQQLLTRRKIASRIHFGVILEEGKLKGHCWLTWQGILINDSSGVIAAYSELTGPLRQSIEAMLLEP